MAPKQEAARANPVEMDTKSRARGEATYMEHCASCHGPGAGGLSASESGLDQETPDLGKRLLTHTDGDFFWKIKTGRGDMPSFEDELSDTQIWEVIHFIRQSAQ
jgi:mono/diheme cytochrome c family protein